jgi:hypothetical protein
MPEGQVTVRLQTRGAEEMQRDMELVRSKIRGVSDSQVTYAKTTNEAGRQARQLNGLQAQQTQIFLAQHPAVNSLSRAMSTFSSISRGALAVTSAFSLAMIAFNTGNSHLTELKSSLQQVEREMALTTDPEKWRELADEAGVLKEKIKELNDQMTQTQINNLLNYGAAIGIMGSTFMKVALAAATSKIFISALLPVLGTFALLAAVVAGVVGAIALAFYLALTPGDQFQDFINQFFPSLSGWVEDTGKVIDDFFTMHIPNAFIFMANTAIDVFNTVNNAFAFLVNQFVAGINKIISAANVVASAIGLPTMKLVPEMKALQAPNIAYMESRNWGAGGPGTYGAAKGMSDVRGPGGFSVTVNNHFEGSLITENELQQKTLEGLKEDLKRLGFPGN